MGCCEFQRRSHPVCRHVVVRYSVIVACARMIVVPLKHCLCGRCQKRDMVLLSLLLLPAVVVFAVARLFLHLNHNQVEVGGREVPKKTMCEGGTGAKWEARTEHPKSFSRERVKIN